MITYIGLLGFLVYLTESFVLDTTKNFSTITPYDMKEKHYNDFENYEVVYTELVCRHGSRNPTESKIKKFEQAINVLEKYTLNTYERHWDPKKEGELIGRGKKELQFLGDYYRKEFEKLYKGHSMDQINVTSSFKKRTHDSAIEFLRGFYRNEKNNYYKLFDEKTHQFKEDNGIIPIQNLKKNEDIYLFYHKNCNRYHKYMKTKEPFEQSKAYEEELLPKIIHKILKRMEARGELRPEVLEDPKLRVEFASEMKKLFHDIYRLAQYEYIVNDKRDGLIQCFDSNDTFDLSFFKDLETYRTKGNYSTLNYYIAIPLLESIMNNIKSHLPETDKDGYIHMDNENKIIGNFRFAHAETVTPLMTLLGLELDDYPLTKDITEHQRQTRKWNSSKMSQFSSHFMFAVLKDKEDQYYVKTYFNQVPVKLPACPNSILCPVNDFISYYEKYIHNFDYHEFCDNK